MRVLYIAGQGSPWVTVQHRSPSMRLSEDVMDHFATLSLEEAGLEEEDSRQPIFGFCGEENGYGGVQEQIDYLFDGEDSRYEDN